MKADITNELPDRITLGDKYGPAMEITEQAEADAYFEKCVRHCMRFGKSRGEAEVIEKSNLGYYAGYYDRDTMNRVNRLFRTAHPVFGATPPTPEQAFAAGVALAGKDGE